MMQPTESFEGADSPSTRLRYDRNLKRSSGSQAPDSKAKQHFGEAQLFVFVILSQDRRRVVHVAVTERPTAGWVAHQ